MKISEKKIWIVLYSEDAFEGAEVPYEWKDMVEVFEKLSDKVDRQIGVFENYEEYRDAEVEGASQARDGSYGTTVYSDKEKFYDEHIKSLLRRLEVNENI